MSNAQSDSGASSANTSGINFAIEAQGSFASLVQTIRLFETLPVPSQIQEVELQGIPNTGVSASGGHDVSWHLTLRLQIITSAQVSS